MVAKCKTVVTFWTLHYESANNHRDWGVLVAKRRTVVTVELGFRLRVSKVLEITGIQGVLVGKRRTVVTFKDPGEDLQVSKQSTVKPCIRALLQWAAAMIRVMVRRSAEHVIIHEPSYTTCMTCNWKINSNVLGISTPPSPGALWARRRNLR